jgi:hypothetical protein
METSFSNVGLSKGDENPELEAVAIIPNPKLKTCKLVGGYRMAEAKRSCGWMRLGSLSVVQCGGVKL